MIRRKQKTMDSVYTDIVTVHGYIGASKPKWVNPDDIQYGVNSLRLEGLNIKLKCMCYIHEVFL